MKKIMCLAVCMLIILSFMTVTFAGAEKLIDVSWNIVGTVAWLGYAVALGMMIFIGIKYMLGSVDAKANMKSALSAYCIGLALLVCASTIALVVAKVASGTDNIDNSLASSIITNANNAAGMTGTTNTNTNGGANSSQEAENNATQNASN